MEEAKEVTRGVNCPRKLDLNLPLLSTRRLGSHTGEENSCTGNSRVALQDASNRIPFCWEQAPGKPKDLERNDIHGGETPRPRLPPCRWHLQKEATEDDNNDHVVNIYDQDDGCDADIDDDGNDDNDEDEDEDDVFSDAVEVLSLTEAIDIVQKAEDNHGLDRLNTENHKFADSPSPSYMIERFLPDATAIAASSAIHASKNLNKKLPYLCNYGEDYSSQTVGGSYPSESSQKGCGIEILFPWRMKHKLCGVKSPVRQFSQNLQPQQAAKQRKHCSTNRPFRGVNKNI